MEADVNKVYLPIRERDMLEYSLETVNESSTVSLVVIVVRDADGDKARALLDRVNLRHPSRVAIGGDSRHESEYAGLNAIRAEIESGDVDIVAIHDGARPFMTLDMLDDIVATADERGGAIPGLELSESLYQIGADSVELIPTETLRRVQTPQAFRAGPLLAAYDAAEAAGFVGVDTAETVERYAGLDVQVVNGDPRNIKVTFIQDIFVAEDYALDWSKGTWMNESGGR